MLIKDVAEELGVHSSTVSRVVANKHAHTPQGVIELRKFFTSGIESSDGENLSVDENAIGGSLIARSGARAGGHGNECSEAQNSCRHEVGN